MKKRICVTGARGFLGSHMVSFLEKKGYYVRIVLKADLRNYEEALRITEDMDYVFHFAANMGGIGYFSEKQYYPIIDNFLIDLNILNACEVNNVERLFYSSSACAYPVSKMDKGIPLEENMLNYSAQPDQMYGWEKLTMLKLMRLSPVNCRVGILHTIYGEGQEYKGMKAKFPPQIAYKTTQAKETNKIEVWGNGKQSRTFLYIGDAIKKIYEVMMSKQYFGEVNIGSDKETSINDVVSICCDILKIKPKIVYNLKKPTGPVRRRCSNDKFNLYYKTRDKVGLKKGFTKIINYIKKKENIK